MSTKNLIEALREVLESEEERDAARDQFFESGGSDWWHHGFPYIHRCDKAAMALESALDAVIEDRVRAILAKII